MLLALILKWASYIRWGIVALVGIVAMILSSADAGSWPFWVTLAVFVVVAWLSRNVLGEIFTKGWKIAMVAVVFFLVLVVFFRVWPVATSAVASLWNSTKNVVASTAGQSAPAVDMTIPTLPTSQVVQTTPPVTPTNQPTVVTQGCPPGYVCVPVQAVPPSSTGSGGMSLDEIMREGSSREALALSRRLRGDGQ